jgi:hypothetical protein
MRKPKRDQQRTTSGRRPKAKSEEDLQPKDASEVPRVPQNPVDPNPEPAS